jgi:hypothetical protein
MNAQTSLVTRASIDEIVGYRKKALDLFAEAQAVLHQAMEAASRAAGGAGISLSDETASRAFHHGRSEEFIADVRHRIDANAWRHLVMGYGFEKLMDRQAMNEFRDQLAKDPPELTAEIAEATLLQLMGDADMLFRRGIANAFSKLDRRFRSHDGFKIGSRVVLDHAFSDHGSWNHHRNHQDTLRDIERTFFQLDGKELPERYAGIVGAVDGELRGVYGPTAFQVESDYFRFKAFKNGNAHVWFRRDDLLEKVNRLLAEHYGEVLGAGSDAVEDDPFDVFRNPRTDLARNMGWFPTPAKVVSEVVCRAEVVYARCYQPDGRKTVRILEPSAGEGAIAMGAVEAMREGGVQPEFTCVELNPERAAWLRTAGFVPANGHETVQEDFLACTPERLGLFEYVLMNPPFDLQRDIDHVVHATRFLAPGGRLVAIMSAGVEFRENRKAVAFRALVERMEGEIYDLPLGSFEESGTMVSTCIVVMRAPRG